MFDSSSSPVTRKSSQTEHTLALPEQRIRYTASAEWQTLFEPEKPIAEMFHVAYFASNHLADLMKLDPEIRPNLKLTHYQGGHMFYAWDQSRQRWFDEMKSFYRNATTP